MCQISPSVTVITKSFSNLPPDKHFPSNESFYFDLAQHHCKCCYHLAHMHAVTRVIVSHITASPVTNPRPRWHGNHPFWSSSCQNSHFKQWPLVKARGMRTNVIFNEMPRRADNSFQYYQKLWSQHLCNCSHGFFWGGFCLFTGNKNQMIN